MISKNKIDILGVKVNNLTFNQAANLATSFFKKTDQFFIATPNPEMIILAQKDKQFKQIINSADLAIPDGFGLILASRILSFNSKLHERVSGIDLAQKLIEYCAKKDLRIGFLGGKEGVAEKAAKCQFEKYKKLKIAFALSSDPDRAAADIVNSLQTTDYRKKEKESVVSRQNAVDLLFVAYGFPKQEKWVFENLNKIPVKVAMVVGGAFDVWSGNLVRSPKIIQVIGFEWLFRLAIQPWRIKRQLALLEFVWLVVKEKFKQF